MFFRGMIHILSFLLPNMFQKRDFYEQRSKSFKIYPKVSKIEVEIFKTQEKTRNSMKKLKVWEDFTPSERPGVTWQVMSQKSLL